MRLIKLTIAVTLVSIAPALGAGKPTRFWNLTSSTVKELRLAPAGTEQFGENQCLNDKDAEVDHDERLKVADVETDQYDAKIGFAGGRICRAKNLSVEAGQVFSIEDRDLVDCSK
ncbi:hypothetical protein [Methylocella tundrae]|uniref:Uncharacterized protein n=1 Tax=Methylocella tundrae TaxID=227605 RepID=A0A4U8Z0N5_METTU|nr:hypothetical protein [Methylocella tundrae]WPP05954.1 hypothetical protein SIN04_09185 [Methylocella tundrae]VFU08521.1 conserved exported protein of unknown function [Methylocella tundrae]